MGIAANKWITQVQIYRKEVSAVLYEFRVGNYLSYKDVQGIRMAPVLPREASEKGTKYGPVSNLMFLYGPNASGKSNIVKAIEFAKNVVYEGSSFKVDQFYEQNPIKIRPSYFEFVFDMSESGNYNVYSFGFEINASGRYFESEWLCNLSAKEDKFLYQISNEGADPKGEVLGLPIIFSRIDPNYSEFNISWNDQIIEDLEYNNNMFWPIQINQIDYPELKELESLCSNVRNYIYKSILIKIGNSSVDGIKFENFDEHSVYECNIKIKEFNEYLTSVKNILPAKMQVDFWDSSRDLFWENHTSDPDMLNLRIEGIFFKNDENAPKISIDAEKTSAELATDCDFAGGKAPIEYQSSGTFRMIYLITLLFQALKREEKKLSTILVIDEIECNLNSNTLLGFLNEFCKLNLKHTQLIVTTHETRILEEKYATPDTISFVQRKSGTLGESEIYTLRCFGNTPKYSAISYLDNRFDSMPVFKQPVFKRRP